MLKHEALEWKAHQLTKTTKNERTAICLSSPHEKLFPYCSTKTTSELVSGQAPAGMLTISLGE